MGCAGATRGRRMFHGMLLLVPVTVMVMLMLVVVVDRLDLLVVIMPVAQQLKMMSAAYAMVIIHHVPMNVAW